MDDETTASVAPAPAVDDNQPTDTASSTDQSSADVQVEQVAPEATQDTGETSSEVKAEDTAEERLYAGKYKSVDDLEKSYTELQSKATRDAQEKAELARILNETFTAPEQPQSPQASSDTESYDSYEAPDPVAQEIATLKTKDTLRDFTMLHPDADGKSIVEIANSDPVAKQITDLQAKLEYAYLKSQSTAAPKAMAEAEQKARAETQAKTAEKQLAQVEGARQQAQPTNDNKELSPSELRDAMRDPARFDELVRSKFPGISKMRVRK